MNKTLMEQLNEQLGAFGVGSFVSLLWYMMCAVVLLLCVKAMSGLVSGVLGPIFSGATTQLADGWAKLKGASKASDLEKRVDRIEDHLGLSPQKPLTPEEENEILRAKLAAIEGAKPNA